MLRRQGAPRPARAQVGQSDPVTCADMPPPRTSHALPRARPVPCTSAMRARRFSTTSPPGERRRMVLRIEDTDAERSEDALLARLLEDLRWLGLEWAEGPDVGGAHGPYRQSERGEHYVRAMESLEAQGRVYPCFCSPRNSSCRASPAGRGPAATLRRNVCLAAAAEVARRIEAAPGPRCASGAAGTSHRVRRPDPRAAALRERRHRRFRHPPGGRERGVLLGNAVDDAEMGITLVLRGDDHLANTPRQIMLLEALAMPVPRYGHLPLLLGPNGSRSRSAMAPRAWAICAHRVTCRARCATTSCGSVTPARPRAGSD